MSSKGSSKSTSVVKPSDKATSRKKRRALIVSDDDDDGTTTMTTTEKVFEADAPSAADGDTFFGQAHRDEVARAEKELSDLQKKLDDLKESGKEMSSSTANAASPTSSSSISSSDPKKLRERRMAKFAALTAKAKKDDSPVAAAASPSSSPSVALSLTATATTTTTSSAKGTAANDGKAPAAVTLTATVTSTTLAVPSAAMKAAMENAVKKVKEAREKTNSNAFIVSMTKLTEHLRWARSVNQTEVIVPLYSEKKEVTMFPPAFIKLFDGIEFVRFKKDEKKQKTITMHEWANGKKWPSFYDELTGENRAAVDTTVGVLEPEVETTLRALFKNAEDQNEPNPIPAAAPTITATATAIAPKAATSTSTSTSASTEKKKKTAKRKAETEASAVPSSSKKQHTEAPQPQPQPQPRQKSTATRAELQAEVLKIMRFATNGDWRKVASVLDVEFVE